MRSEFIIRALPGFEDAISHTQGEPAEVVEHTPQAISTTAIREKAGLRQRWAKVAERDPKAVIKAVFM